MIPVARDAVRASGPDMAALRTPCRFAPQPQAWRTFEVTTDIALAPDASAQVWLPLPSVDTDWQQSLDHRFDTTGQARIVADAASGAHMLHVQWNAPQAATHRPIPRTVRLHSRVRTRNRVAPWAPNAPATELAKVTESAAALHRWTQPTALIPTDGIVADTAQRIVQGQRTDRAKARAIYDWVVCNAWREPQTSGCGLGDIQSMLESGNLGGKCADLNALFVGLCRAAGLPARDVYGLRLAPSAFGYRELSANPAQLQGAQHCRAEVYLQAHGWVAMDPADVAKVMRQEGPEWIKDPAHPLVQPVYEGLFGSWEGNWLAWNMAHDIPLPGSTDRRLGFFMYPVGETAQGRLNSYAPDAFTYRIAAREA